jgi:1,4-dihydroxy-2-naphthoyl-CoA synthase
MIDNIHNNQAPHAMGADALAHADAVNRRLCRESDATLQVDFADLVNEAIQTDESEVEAVQKARELLQSSRLTTPANIRSAAENILTFGI